MPTVQASAIHGIQQSLTHTILSRFKACWRGKNKIKTNLIHVSYLKGHSVILAYTNELIQKAHFQNSNGFQPCAGKLFGGGELFLHLGYYI